MSTMSPVLPLLVLLSAFASGDGQWDWCLRQCNPLYGANYPRIRHNGAAIACSSVCWPDTAIYGGCYTNEQEGTECLVFEGAKHGICYKGECISNGSTIEQLLRGAPKTGGSCKRGWDYFYNKRTGKYAGCKYYCAEPPYPIAASWDGSPCLDPSTAVRQKCSRRGYCTN